MQVLSAALLLLLFTASGCASTPAVGVREGFEAERVQRVAVVPFYALGRFSLSAEQLAQVLEGSELAAVQSLEMKGFEVVGPAEFLEHLKQAGMANAFEDGVLLNRDLEEYFEARGSGASGSADELPLEVSTVVALSQEGVFEADALLFGQVIYHTRTRCDADPTQYTPYAVISGTKTPSADDHPSSLERGAPCIVSHFQAKLVHLPSGETMWFNRVYLQTFTPDAQVESPKAEYTSLENTGVEKNRLEKISKDHIAETVARSLNGEHGLQQFEPGDTPDKAVVERD